MPRTTTAGSKPHSARAFNRRCGEDDRHFTAAGWPARRLELKLTPPRHTDCEGISGGPRVNSRDRWQRERGVLQPGMQLHHVCLNPWCVNLDHLVEVSKKEHREEHRWLEYEQRGLPQLTLFDQLMKVA